jgi:hypothetical protein
LEGVRNFLAFIFGFCVILYCHSMNSSFRGQCGLKLPIY